MSYSTTVPYSGSNTIYAKPVSEGSTPSNTPSWSSDIIASGTPAYGAVPFTSLTDGQIYWIFERAGGSPANTDLVLGVITPEIDISTISSNVSSVLTEIQKIPRASGAITAGSPFRRNKNFADETNFVEFLEPE